MKLYYILRGPVLDSPFPHARIHIVMRKQRHMELSELTDGAENIYVMTKDIPREEMSSPLYAIETKKGTSMNKEENNSTIPVRLKTRAVFIEEVFLPA